MKNYELTKDTKFEPINVKKSDYTKSFINYGDNKDVISVGRGSVYIPPECRCTKSEYEKSIKDTKREIKELKKGKTSTKKKVKKKKVKKVKKRVSIMYRKKEYKISKLKTGKIKVLIDGEIQSNVTKTLSPIYKYVLKKDVGILGTRAIAQSILKSLS
jgi:hypothetical protein